jgi:hypothetical protein
MQQTDSNEQVFTVCAGERTAIMASKRSVVVVTVNKDGYLTAETYARPVSLDVSIRMCEDYAGQNK